MSKTYKPIPLLLEVHELDEKPMVYFAISSPDDIENLMESGRVNEGDWITLRARVYEVKRLGGYQRSLEDGVLRRDLFALDLGSIYLTGVEKV